MRKIAVVLLAVTLGACAGLSNLARTAFEEPKLTFRTASLEALDFEGATVAFRFELENPNRFGLDVARVGWAVEVEETRVAAGDLPGGVTVPARGTAPVTFPVRVRFGDVPGIVSLLRGGRDEIGYRLSGTIGVRSPVGVVDVPLSHTGRLPVPDPPRFALDGVAVRNASMHAIGADVRVRVRNPNRFALPAGKLDYALAIAGAPVARAETLALAPVPGGSSAIVEVPVRIDVASAGRAASELARGGEVEVELTGTASLGGVPLPLELKARVPARR
jgi:LEA14-like dessication related protein